MLATFSEIPGLAEELKKTLDSLNYVKPTELQQCLPMILRRRNLMCCAESETGKSTLAAILLVQNYLQKRKAIVICSTSSELQKMNKKLQDLGHFQVNMRIQIIENKPAKWDILLGAEDEFLLLLRYYAKILRNVELIIIYGYKNLSSIPELFDIIKCLKLEPQILILSKQLPLNDMRKCETFLKSKADTVVYLNKELTMVKHVKSRRPSLSLWGSKIFSTSSTSNEKSVAQPKLYDPKGSVSQIDEHSKNNAESDSSAGQLFQRPEMGQSSCESATEDDWNTVINLLDEITTDSSPSDSTLAGPTCSFSSPSDSTLAGPTCSFSSPSDSTLAGVTAGSFECQPNPESGMTESDSGVPQDRNKDRQHDADLLSLTNSKLHQKMLGVILCKEKQHCCCQNSIFKGLSSEALKRDTHLKNMCDHKNLYVQSSDKIDGMIKKLSNK